MAGLTVAAPIPPAAARVLAAWLAILPLVIGWGSLVRFAGARLLGRALGEPPPAGANLLLSAFWLGFAALLLALDAWHLFLPIDARATAAAAAIGALGLALAGPGPWLSVLRTLRRPRAWPVALAWAAIVAWLAVRALGGPRHGDTSAYFLPTMRWYEAHPVVPGLGLLYPLFAYNQSYFRWVALLDAGPLPGRATHLANSVLLVAATSRSLLGLGRLVAARARCATADVFHACLLPLVAALGLGLLYTSPAPDFAVFLLGIAIFAPLLEIGRDDASPTARMRGLLSIALLAVAGLTLKLSLAALGAGSLLVGALLWWRGRPTPRDAAIAAVAIAATGLFGVGTWVVGNILQSGCPLFPSAFGALDVEWRVDRDVAAWIRDLVRPLEPAAAWRAPLWALRTLGAQGWSEPDALAPAATAAACLALAPLLRLAGRRRVAAPGVSAWTLLPTLGALAFSLLIAAAPRFAGALPWLLAAQGVLLAFGASLTGPRRAARLALAALVLAGAAAMRLPGEPLLPETWDFETYGLSPCDRVRLPSGLEVHVPRDRRACGDAPLPCTTEANPRLTARRPGDLSAGFALRGPAPGGATGGPLAAPPGAR